MNNMVKASVFSVTGMVLSQLATLHTFASSTASESTFGVWNATKTTAVLENDPLQLAVQQYVNYIMTFLYLIAVMYALWGGFQILTAWGEEDKVSTGKTILIQWALGLLVIWLSWTIVKWILSVLVAV